MQQVLSRLRENIAAVLFGNTKGIDAVVCCLLARGHILIEDVPGVGKTLLATALARSIDCSFSRIQLTPDLLPSDISGVTIYDKNTSTFTFKPGPLFANIIVADEINRTPPRTQSALLEAMSESTVSIDGKVIPLELPFMVVATQNPYEFEGTYPLPENQLDRFLMRINLGYPDPESEARVLELRPSAKPLQSLSPVLHKGDILDMQAAVDQIAIAKSLIDYIVLLANASRKHPGLIHGLSPRGTLALSQAARARAYMSGRTYVIPDDIVSLWLPVCAHRVIAKRNRVAPQVEQVTTQPKNSSTNTTASTLYTDEASRILASILASIPTPL